MSNSVVGWQHVRPSVLGMVVLNGSPRSLACIPRRSGAAATNSTMNCELVQPTVSDSPEADVRASKKRSHSDRGPETGRRSRNGRQSVFGREVGALAIASVVEALGSPCLSDDDRSFAAKPKV